MCRACWRRSENVNEKLKKCADCGEELPEEEMAICFLVSGKCLCKPCYRLHYKTMLG